MVQRKLLRVCLTGGLVVLGALGALVACGSDDAAPGGASSSSGSTADETVTVHVSAAAGGTVTDKAGKAKLDIPPGALAADTDITLKISAKSGNAVAEIADFGPDGLQFLKPATLSLKGDASLAPAGKSLAVAIENGAEFTALPGSTYANGVATANVEHFTKFTLVVVEGQVTLVDPSSCQDARSKFVACGGDPKGTWLFTDFCPDPSMFPGDPTGGKCPQYAVSVEFTTTREVTIDATTTTNSAGTETFKLTADFPITCFQEDGGGASSCDQLSKTDTTCTDKGGGQCQCVQTKTEQKPAGSPEAYTLAGNTWTNSDGTSSGEYCVSGDILYYKEKAAEGKQGLLYVLKRKQ